MDRPLCKRCLIRETSQIDIMKSIEVYWKESDPEIICSKDEYEFRLGVCKDCKYLNFGMCSKSGFYVEAKAYRSNEHCPLSLY